MPNNDGGTATNDGNSDDGNGQAAAPAPVSLDEVHEQIQNERGEEFSRPEASDDDTSDDTNDANTDTEGTTSTEDDSATDTDTDSDDDTSDTSDDTTSEEEEDTTSDTTSTEELTPPERDDDLTKPGKYKAEFVDEEGNKHYVSDLTQLPDEFEPRSSKEYGIAMQDLFRKQQQYDADDREYQQNKTVHDTNQAVTQLRESWNKDIETLTTEKALPEDSKERQKVINGVYALMDAEMKKGNTIDKWATAYELYEAREAKKAAAAAEKQEIVRKKQAGGKVMGSGAPTGTGGRSKIREGLPPGVSLDQVHDKVISELQS
jgi:hypothetical protein